MAAEEVTASLCSHGNRWWEISQVKLTIFRSSLEGDNIKCNCIAVTKSFAKIH